MDLHNLPKRNRTYGVLLVGVLLFGYGGYGIVSQSSGLSGSVTVSGTVQSAGVVEVDSRGGVEYRPDVAYSYSVDGTDYMSTDIYPSGMAPSFDTREEADLGLQDGETVTVYLSDPNSPESSFLRHERSMRPFLITGIGLLMVLVTVYTFYRDR